MKNSIEALFDKGPVILDGGMGSALIARGLEAGKSPEAWNLERPDDVRAVHAAYYDAGSHVVQTNTFGGNPFVLKKHRLEDKLEEINVAAVENARSAGGEEHFVAGNIGPSGLMLQPLGEATLEELEEGFGRQAAALAQGGADYLSIETMIDINEALCALRGARRFTDLPVTVCLTFEQKKRGFFTLMGNRPEDCARALCDEGALAVGANCSISSDIMLLLCPILVDASPAPVILKPNAGQPKIVNGDPVYAQTPEDFARELVELVEKGARAVGGCCGTDHRFIEALSKELSR